jgi:hypothetical protein
LFEEITSTRYRAPVWWSLVFAAVVSFACGSNSIIFTAMSGAPGPTGAGVTGTGGSTGSSTFSTTGLGMGGSSEGSGRLGSGGAGGGSAGSVSAGGSSACYRDCPGTPCARLDAPWRTVVTHPDTSSSISAFAIGSDYLYFGTSVSSSPAPGEIDRVALSGGAKTVLASNVQVRELLLDGDSLYYVDNISRGETSSLRVIPTSGGPHETIASDSRLSNVRIDANYIYYSTSDAFGSARIMRVTRQGLMSPPEVVVESRTPWGFEIDADALYWTQYDNGGTLFRRALAGGPTTTLATSTQSITTPVLHGEYVYFFYGGTPAVCVGAVLRVPRTGGLVEQISPGNTGVASLFGGLAVDEAYVYWAQLWGNGDDWILRAPIAGGNPEFLETTQRLGGGITATATDIYWAAHPTMAGGYEIRAIAK